MRPEPLEFRPTRAKTAFQLLLSIGMAVACAFLLAVGDGSTEDLAFGGLGTVLFGLCAVIALYGLIRPKAVLRLGPDRIVAVSPFGKTILDFPLAQLAEARVVRRSRTKFVALVPHDPDRGLEDALPKPTKADGLSRVMFGTRFTVMPSMFGVNPKTLAEAIETAHRNLVQGDGAYPRPMV